MALGECFPLIHFDSRRRMVFTRACEASGPTSSRASWVGVRPESARAPAIRAPTEGVTPALAACVIAVRPSLSMCLHGANGRTLAPPDETTPHGRESIVKLLRHVITQPGGLRRE